MLNLKRLLPALALVTIGAGCGSSPTAPDTAGTPLLNAPSASGSSSTPGLQEGTGFAPPACEVSAMELSPVPSRDAPTDRLVREVEVHYKGDPTGCPALTWYTSPSAKLVVDEKQPVRARVYDPGDKFGIVDVTANLEPLKLTSTLRVTFPRNVR